MFIVKAFKYFKMIFKIQKPLSNVYIILNTEDVKSNKTYIF